MTRHRHSVSNWPEPYPTISSRHGRLSLPAGHLKRIISDVGAVIQSSRAGILPVTNPSSLGIALATSTCEDNLPMSLVRLLGYTTLACGCVVGRYREVASSREIAYVEEKGASCGSHG